MLPSSPKNFGRLSEVFVSALDSVLGRANSLKFESSDSFLVILVDGLGVVNLRHAAAHARFLNHESTKRSSLFSGFPTTTASSLTSLATGLVNGDHSIIGYRVHDRSLGKSINFLNDLGADLNPRVYQSSETVSERGLRSGVDVIGIGSAEYEHSGFTKATMPAAKYQPANSIAERFAAAKRQLRSSGKLLYLYIPELDQSAHRFGSDSNSWLALVEEVDSELRRLSKDVPKNVKCVLTADHGILNVPKTRHVYLDEFDSFSELLDIGGDPRAPFLYFPLGTDLEAKRAELEQDLNRYCSFATFDELAEAGWLSRPSENSRRLVPDFVIIAKGERVFYHRDFASKRSLEMIGQHGGLSKAEWEVPLIRI
jgi:hypothetical protein